MQCSIRATGRQTANTQAWKIVIVALLPPVILVLSGEAGHRHQTGTRLHADESKRMCIWQAGKDVLGES